MKITEQDKIIMKEFSNKNDKFAFSFLPSFDKNYDIVPGKSRFECFKYKNIGEKLGGTGVGDEYEILTFSVNDNGYVENIERFAAILIEPVEYIMRLVEINIFGYIGKKTTTSDEVFSNIETGLKNFTS